MKKNLPPSYLGKKVYMDEAENRYYVIRYEEHTGKKRTHVLLFDQESPVIFAVLHHDGHFSDSFYLSNKTTELSAKVLTRYKKIADRRKQHRVTQDDLRDALKPEGEAKMKNENIMKHLIDEHLEDIKNLWPSRLLTLQNAYGKSEESLILTSLKEALQEANSSKAFHFLLRHRYDSLVPLLAHHIESNPKLLEDVTKFYLGYDQSKIVEDFILEAVDHLSVHNEELIEKLLSTAQDIDHVHFTKVLRVTLRKLFKRVTSETGATPREWLKDTVHDKKLKHSIVVSLKKKTG
ncbi:hypothetical protein LGQ02_04725 [Bacillus shivajii]|uniref:hypothetical protein n=1 Tax=Bacillus shivajii TaxID=1983719 RepID=UPI001CFA24BC|nr:hypothetical protein [Bacillus shivajii]UCZ54090.1 hypothetical protein LGQ02_04725 [Bacillus shivajii]